MRSTLSGAACALAACVVLVACDSSSGSSTGGDNTGKTDTTGNVDPADIDGSMTIDGRTVDISVSALLKAGDTVMTLTVMEENAQDKGWSGMIPARARLGTYTLGINDFGSWSDDRSSTCAYRTQSGSVTISSWSQGSIGGRTAFTFSGSATVVLVELYSTGSGSCPDKSATLQFTDATIIQM